MLSICILFSDVYGLDSWTFEFKLDYWPGHRNCLYDVRVIFFLSSCLSTNVWFFFQDCTRGQTLDNILLFKPLRHGTEQNARDQNPEAPLHVTVEIIPWVLADNIGHVQPEDSFWCLLADVMFSLPSVSPCEERAVVQNPQHVAFVLGTLMGFHIKRAFPPPCCVLSVQWQCTHDNLSQRNSYGTCNKAGLTEHFNCPPWGLVIPPCYPHVQLCNFNDPNFFKKKGEGVPQLGCMLEQEFHFSPLHSVVIYHPWGCRLGSQEEKRKCNRKTEEGGRSDPRHVNQASFMMLGHPGRRSALVGSENSQAVHMS